MNISVLVSAVLTTTNASTSNTANNSIFDVIPEGCPREDIHYILDELLQVGNVLTTNTPIFHNCLPLCGLCPPLPNPEYFYFNVILSGVILPILGVLGLMGNALAAFIFSRRESHSSTNSYLFALACSDNATILTAIFLYGFESYKTFSPFIFTSVGALSPIFYSMSNIAQVCSVYFTLAAAVDCFVDICLVDKVRLRYCCGSTVRRIVPLVVIFSFFYNLPHYFETVVVECFHEGFAIPTFEVCPHPMRTYAIYKTIYAGIVYPIFVAIGPLCCLILLNLAIVRESVFGKENKEMGDTMSLILVVLLFIVCNSIALALNFDEDLMERKLGQYYNYVLDVSNLLVVFNSSFNFVIYISFARNFRRTLRLYLYGENVRNAKEHTECLHRAWTKKGLLVTNAPASALFVTNTGFT